MTVLKIIAQCFGLIGIICLFISYQQKQRNSLILFKLCSDVMWVIHYLCLSAYGGAIPNFVGIFREIVFMKNDKKWAKPIVWPIFFIIVNWVLAISTWRSWITLIPIVASTAVTISLWLKNPTATKIICVPVSIAFIVYDVFVGSWIGIVNESIALISIASFFCLNASKKQRDAVNAADKAPAERHG